MNKVRAFTMLEALISLILTGIIITLCYTLFMLMNKQMAIFEKENTEIINYNLFNTTLRFDINNSNNFSFDNNRLILKNYINPDVIYDFDGKDIRRTVKGLNTDVFKITALNKKVWLSDTLSKSHISISIKLLNDTLYTNYFLNKSLDIIINENLFYED